MTAEEELVNSGITQGVILSLEDIDKLSYQDYAGRFVDDEVSEDSVEFFEDIEEVSEPEEDSVQSVDISQCCSERSEPYANDYEPENSFHPVDEEGYYSVLNSNAEGNEEADEQDASSEEKCSVFTEDLEKEREEELKRIEALELERQERARKNI